MDGVVVMDKSSGVTSHDVVARIRRILRQRQVGHFGTLDPLATGVLPVAVGRATRLQQFYLASRKSYRGTICFGFSTSTYDSDGTPSSEIRKVCLRAEDLESARSGFLGEIDQIPPAFSAKKINGVSAHRLARKNREVSLQPARVSIFRFDLTMVSPSEAEFAVECSSGTYIRSLAHDLGQQIGCGAHLTALRRSASGEFSLEQSVPFAAIDGEGDERGKRDLVMERMIPLKNLLRWMPGIAVEGNDLKRLKNGLPTPVQVDQMTRENTAEPSMGPAGWYRILQKDGSLIGLGISSPSSPGHGTVELKPKVILVAG